MRYNYSITNSIGKRFMNTNFKAIISAFLVAVMLVACLPFSASAGTVTAARITKQSELKSGRYVIVCSENSYAMTSLSSSPYWINTAEITDNNGAVKVSPDVIWTVTVSGTSVTLTDPNGNTVSPVGGNKNGIKIGSYEWRIVFENGTVKLCGINDDTVRLACNTTKGTNAGNNRFRAYKNTTAGKNNYPDDFIFYKVVDMMTDETENSDSSAGHAPSEVTIPEAINLADGTAVTVRGTVTHIGTPWSETLKNNSVTISDNDGNTLYVYRLQTKVEIGDLVKINGVMTTYGRSRQIASGATAEFIKVDDVTSEPDTTEPITTEPATTEPATTEPITTEPITTEPVTAEPETTAPIPSDPISDKIAVKITDKKDLVSGRYLIVTVNNHAMSVFDEDWVLSSEIDGSRDIIHTVYPVNLWTVTVKDEFVILTDPNGINIAPKGKNSNGIKKGEYQWALSFKDGAFGFSGVGEDTVKLSANKSYDFKLRAYKISTVEGRYSNNYCADFYMFKVVDRSEVPETQSPATESPATEPPITESPTTEPPTTEPPTTEPPTTEPPTTEPPTTEPPTTKPPTTEPPATEPPTTEPPTAEPPTTESPTTEPPATEPPTTEPPTTEPPATEPLGTEPPTTDAPETELPETEIPITEASQTTAPETEVPEITASETDFTDTVVSETYAPEPSLPGTDTYVDNSEPYEPYDPSEHSPYTWVFFIVLIFMAALACVIIFFVRRK